MCFEEFEDIYQTEEYEAITQLFQEPMMYGGEAQLKQLRNMLESGETLSNLFQLKKLNPILSLD
ncbi:MAG: hypothetical protein JWM44_4267 [Bacilli bacterium]|nr:hypothetical protein [Bacilli bacterium]